MMEFGFDSVLPLTGGTEEDHRFFYFPGVFNLQRHGLIKYPIRRF